MPVERDLIFSSRLTVELRLDNLTFCVDGLRIVMGRLDGTDILLDGSWARAIDAIPPLPYSEVSVHREEYVGENGAPLAIRDRYDSHGDDLTCRHEIECARRLEQEIPNSSISLFRLGES